MYTHQSVQISPPLTPPPLSSLSIDNNTQEQNPSSEISIMHPPELPVPLEQQKNSTLDRALESIVSFYGEDALGDLPSREELTLSSIVEFFISRTELNLR